MNVGASHADGIIQPSNPTPDSIATAVFIAALNAKGYGAAATCREMQARLIQELRQMGVPVDLELAGTDQACSFSVRGLVLVRVMEPGQDKTVCLEELRADLLAHNIPLGLLIDFKSSLVMNGITRVNLRDADNKEKKKGKGG